MTIHDSHPFPAADDPARRLRGRLGGAVTLWTTGGGGSRAGLTVSSVMLAGGEPARLLALVDPDSDLADTLEVGDRAVVHLLSWRHRALADAFAGVAPAPGGPFRAAGFDETGHGPRLADAATWALVTLEATAVVGWSRLLTAVVDEIHLGDDDRPLLHRRGRYATLEPPS
jgi:flavin reductase (DIM6/NTAB) family NADH-FMN oxidoreductase RutF